MRLLLLAPAFVAALSAPAQNIGVTSATNGSGYNNQYHTPVSTVTETKSVQTLSDGTHITHINHTWFYRDSQGRTRNEFELGGMLHGSEAAPRMVNVSDPVAGQNFHWQTESQDHKVTVLPMHGRPSLPATQADAATVPSPARVHAVTNQLRPQHTTEQLGSKTVAGLTCDATRITTTYPTDSMGNDRPIATTDERCFSRELGIILESSREDPRSGTQTTTVTSITTTEPDASLFAPPPNYTEQPH